MSEREKQVQTETSSAGTDAEIRSNDERMMDSATMESGGTVEADCPNYQKGDDVLNSIAEGYF